MNWVLDYFRLSPITGLLFGGRVNYSGPRIIRSASRDGRPAMLEAFPQLADVRIDLLLGRPR